MCGEVWPENKKVDTEDAPMKDESSDISMQARSIVKALDDSSPAEKENEKQDDAFAASMDLLPLGGDDQSWSSLLSESSLPILGVDTFWKNKDSLDSGLEPLAA